LRENEERYSNMFESAGVSIWKQDFSQVKAALEELKAQGVPDLRQYCSAHPEFVRQAASMVKIVDVNDATVKLFAARSKEDLLGSLHAVLTPETEKVFVEELVAIAEGRSSFASETTLRTLKGEKLAVLLTMTFLPQPISLDSVIVTVVDITERKRAESLTAQFFESSPDGVCIVERDYRYRRVNPVYARRWGAIVGMHVYEVLGVDRFERTLKPNLDRCLSGEEVIFDWSSTSSQRRYFAVSYSPLRMGSEEVEAVLVIQRDITDRKETELALRDSEQRFRDYAEIASDWLWETDAEHRFTLFSRSSSGYAREFVGMRRWDLAVDREQEPEKWRAHIAAMEAHEPFRGFRYRGTPGRFADIRLGERQARVRHRRKVPWLPRHRYRSHRRGAPRAGGASGEIAARSIETRNQAQLHRVTASGEHDRNRTGRRLGSERWWGANRDDHGNPAADKIDCQCRKAIVLVLRPAIFDRQILSLNIADFRETPPDCVRATSISFGQS
jgi:PAS domain S-box-containing protein